MDLLVPAALFGGLRRLDMSGANHSGHGGHTIVPLSTYFRILMVLVVLTVVTVLAAPPITGINLGIFTAIVAFGIASLKAYLVAAYFMHLKYDDRLFTVIMVTCVFFLVLLLAFCFLDWESRAVFVSPL
jgi:cytochrome c oxidase subunit 4